MIELNEVKVGEAVLKLFEVADNEVLEFESPSYG